MFDDPPEPVQKSVYVSSNKFSTDPLETVANSLATYGLIVIEQGQAALGKLTGDRTELVQEFHSQVRGKHSTDEQSQDQYERERKRQKREFFETVAEEATHEFLSDDPVDGLLIGGTTVTVDEFRQGDYLDYRLQERTIGGSFTIEYASEQGLREFIEKAKPHLEPE